MDEHNAVPAELDEAFFEQHFDFCDGEESVVVNLKKALNLFGQAYKATVQFAELAMNGECFEAEEAEQSFYSLALSYKYCREFAGMLEEPVTISVVQNVENGSLQEYVNAYLKQLALCHAGL